MGILSYIKSIFLGKEETTQNNQTLLVDTKSVTDHVSETKVEEPKVEVIEEKLPEVITENPVVSDKEVDPNKSPKNAPKKRPSPKKKPVKSENKTEKPKKSKNTKK